MTDNKQLDHLIGVLYETVLDPVAGIARIYTGRRKSLTGQDFWARGYYVSTVGRNEATVCNYIKHQKEEDKR